MFYGWLVTCQAFFVLGFFLFESRPNMFLSRVKKHGSRLNIRTQMSLVQNPFKSNYTENTHRTRHVRLTGGHFDIT